MALSWSTFLIEIVNFVVLVWLLTRFLYQPVKSAVARRQKAIAGEMQRAQELAAKSDALEKQYENRLVDWEGEKAKLEAAFENEMTAQKATREQQLEAELARKRGQEEAAARTREAENSRELEKRAAEKAVAFASALLARIASPEVEKRIVDVALADLTSLDDDDGATLARSQVNGSGPVVVATRYPLDDARRSALIQALTRVTGRALEIHFEERDNLVAGIRIDLGTAVLEADVAEELHWFAEHSRDGG
ncbi:MAG TPA: F0F1 ATP synthase subunit delta [Candidatus Acidoferrales bacterium]|nr:F0F1 ATP synthase subunit delta [Candidatus Acidoferrales bacterium]